MLANDSVLDLGQAKNSQLVEIVVDNLFIGQQETKTFTVKDGRLLLEDGSYLQKRVDPADINPNLFGPGSDVFIIGENRLRSWGQIREIKAH
jgi:hypothetical protein